MKYTKKQLDAINKLIVFLDELDNKPRRLFSALIEFAEVFKPSAIPSIKDAEMGHYYYVNKGDELANMIYLLRNYRIEQWEKEEEEYENAKPVNQEDADEISEALYKKYHNRIIGAEDFVKKYMIDYFNNE